MYVQLVINNVSTYNNRNYIESQVKTIALTLYRYAKLNKKNDIISIQRVIIYDGIYIGIGIRL